MGTLQPVRFVRAWQMYRVGQVIHPPGTLRDWLKAQGFVVAVESETPMEKASERASANEGGERPAARRHHRQHQRGD